MSSHKKIAALLSNPDFVNKLDQATSKEDIINIFNESGLKPTDKELAELGVFIKREHGEELSKAEIALLADSDIEEHLPQGLAFLGMFYQYVLPDASGMSTFHS